MKSGPLFLLGLLVALTLSWAGLVLGANGQLGHLMPYYDEGESGTFPARPSGLAARGQLVYADLGCAACHTQQVRRPDFGSDQARGWGDRQSVARDYIFQQRPQLGAMRIGPDLANLAGRKPSAPDADDLLNLLYTGSATHPSYAFLFDDRAIIGERAGSALKLTGRFAPAPRHEIVPTDRAETLVAYLLSLNNAVDYPEARPVVIKKEGQTNQPAEKVSAPQPPSGSLAPPAPAKGNEKAPAATDAKAAPAAKPAAPTDQKSAPADQKAEPPKK